jgi:hypothetical protein
MHLFIMLETAMRYSTIPRWFFKRLLTLCLLAAVAFFGIDANAQFFDRIEIARKGKEAEIRLQFSVQLQYLSHTPPGEGELLRIAVRLVNSSLPPGEQVQETMRSPATDLVPDFTVTYPDLNDAILVTFSRPTRFSVRPGTDSRSIIITVPVQPGAHDLLVEEKTLEVVKKPVTKPAVIVAKPVVAPVAPSVASTESAAAIQPSNQLATANAPVQPEAAVPMEVAPVAEALPENAVPILSAAETERMANNFMGEARQALAEKDAAKAVNRLNRVLGMPSNSQTRTAQALIGDAREMNGEFAKARAEYELYLKLFSGGAEVASVKEKLAKLPRATLLPKPSSTSSARAVVDDGKPAEWTTYASISQYRYVGKSQIETVTPPPPGQLVFNVDTLSLTDQDMLISTFDVNARRRDSVSDTRIVVRDTDLKNSLQGKSGYNRLYSAYFERTDRQYGYFVRAGRQNPNGGGVLERFDGVSLGYNLNSSWRVNGVTGDTVEFLSPYKKNFYGVSVDLLPQPSQWGFSAYLLEQNLEGALNRRAVGSEARYFDGQATVYGLIDYDIAFKGLNIALVQGNYLAQNGNNYFAVMDHRKSPTYGLTTALPGSPGLSLKEMLAAQGIDAVRAQAQALTPVSDMFAIGFTHPYSPNWQFGADYRYAAISGTEAAGAMPAQPGSGGSHVFSAQAIGSNLFMPNAVGVANASLIEAPTYTGQAYGINYVLILHDIWRFDTNLRYYTQQDTLGENQNRLTPTFKLSYRWKDKVSLEAEVGQEIVKVDGPLRVENSKRSYMFVGYRWDFR